jgi:hypothetical protein
MNLESLLPIANQFISSDAGKKVFGDINVEDSLQQITEIRREISSSEAEFSGSLDSTVKDRTKVGNFISSSREKLRKLSRRTIPRFQTFETVGRINL